MYKSKATQISMSYRSAGKLKKQQREYIEDEGILREAWELIISVY